MATLIVTEGPADGEQFALGEHRIVMIGRDTECTFQIVDQQMSRRHMQVKRDEDGGHVAVDVGSANGVFVNGRQIEGETRLADGDTIRLGETSIVYTTVDTPDAKTLDRILRRQGEHFRSTMVGDSRGE